MDDPTVVQAQDLVERLSLRIARLIQDLAYAEAVIDNAKRLLETQANTIQTLEGQLEKYEAD